MITADLVADETKRDTTGRRITPKARREELLAAYEQSGLTQAEFARREAINYHTFASWVYDRRGRDGTAVGLGTGAQIKFAEVSLPPASPRELSPSADALSVTLPDGLVVRGADALAMATLVKALRA